MKSVKKEIGVGVIGLGMGRNMLEINDDRESSLYSSRHLRRQ